MTRRKWTEAEKEEDALAVKEMLELLPHYGWPKWPPTSQDISEGREWWTEERTTYPSPMKGAAGLSCFIEWTGLSKTGKSSTLQGVGERLTD